MTQQRRLILQEVRRLGSHPTAEEVHVRVRALLPRIGLATVYRNLEKLPECGLLRRLELSGSRRRYDDRVACHYHVRCLGCGGIQDVEVDSVRGLERDVGKTSRYRILGHRLEFVGFCPQCRQTADHGRAVGTGAQPGTEGTGPSHE